MNPWPSTVAFASPNPNTIPSLGVDVVEEERPEEPVIPLGSLARKRIRLANATKEQNGTSEWPTPRT